MATKRKPKTKKFWDGHGNVTIRGITISINTIITSLGCSLAALAFGGVVHVFGQMKTIYDSHPQLIKDVAAIKQEQARVRREYHPATDPKDVPLATPIPCEHSSPSVAQPRP